MRRELPAVCRNGTAPRATAGAVAQTLRRPIPMRVVVKILATTPRDRQSVDPVRRPADAGSEVDADREVAVLVVRDAAAKAYSVGRSDSPE